MKSLLATYRLQFHPGFTLPMATELLPYLAKLGVSHVYASPLFKAKPGSTHGYDVCDYHLLNPELGTDQDMERFVLSLQKHNMGLILDIVPNHMGIDTPENRWWWDVLEHGETSPYARYFDIQWHSSDPRLQGKVLLPVLGDRYHNVLGKGELQVEFENKSWVLRHHDHKFPLASGSLGHDSEPDLEEINKDPDALDEILSKQNYRLTYWRYGDSELNYRRFFTITTLAGLRMEDAQVFEDTHKLALHWYHQGWVHGFRIDHPDGLRDPKQYLERLSSQAPGAWIVVEKILEDGEALPPDWPVAGTTGYDFLNRVGGLFVDPQGESGFSNFYQQFTGRVETFAKLARDKKRFVCEHLLVAEVSYLVSLLHRIASQFWQYRDFAVEEWKTVLVELISSFPVYRTYVQTEAERVDNSDKRVIRQAIQDARHEQSCLDPALFTLVEEVTTLQRRGDLESDFVVRWQQLTGPAMAKALEDTAFYNYNRLVALNEVGANPGEFGVSVEAFHASSKNAQANWPQSMLASSTHDNKRSEDVRARLYLLSEISSDWSEAVMRWSRFNAPFRSGEYPDHNAEYLFYQTLVGAWPLSLERAQAYMEKAACEAKELTDWTQRNSKYETALQEFVAGAIGNESFIRDLESFVAQLIEAGQVNSLAQTLIKLTAPGVPDIYQGSELWDLSLVDPDNRRPVDYKLRRKLLQEAETLDAATIWKNRAEGLPKLWLIQRTLELRTRHSEWFGVHGSYEPLKAIGLKAQHVVAFIRSSNVLTVVPRLVIGLQGRWENTELPLPPGKWKNVLTEEDFVGEDCPLERLFKNFPVALLVRKENG